MYCGGWRPKYTRFSMDMTKKIEYYILWLDNMHHKKISNRGEPIFALACVAENCYRAHRCQENCYIAFLSSDWPRRAPVSFVISHLFCYRANRALVSCVSCVM